MRRTLDQRLAAKRDRFLASLTHESEFFGLIGIGYPNSFYKVYVRARERSPWRKFEGTMLPSRINLGKEQARIRANGAVEAVHGPFKDLVKFTFMPERVAIKKLFDRAEELNRVDPA